MKWSNFNFEHYYAAKDVNVTICDKCIHRVLNMINYQMFPMKYGKYHVIEHLRVN